MRKGYFFFSFFLHLYCTLIILVTAPSCSFWFPLDTAILNAIIVQSISSCQFSLPAHFYFLFSYTVKKIKIFCNEKAGFQNMKLLYSLASKQPPTTVHQQEALTDTVWERGVGNEAYRGVGTTQACRKNEVQIYLIPSK